MVKGKTNSIDLNEYNGKSLYLQELSNDIQSQLRPSLFSIESIEDLHYEALKLLFPVNKKLKKTPDSIKKSIEEVLKHFRFFQIQATVFKHTDKGREKVEPEKKTDIEQFQEHILGFDKLPKEQLEKLMPRVEADLNCINDLVKEYEGNEVVQKFLQEKKITYNHKGRVIIDFYLRCLDKRQEVLDYYLEGVYDRAIVKASPNLFGWNFHNEGFLGQLKDYPYAKWGSRRFGISLNYQDIDSVSHRIRNFPQNNFDYDKLYRDQKETFYRKVFKRRSKVEMLSSIKYYLSYLPFSKDRKPIFIELERLFRSRRWLAYYALALPQVEGLFSEMIKSANPNSKTIQKALSDKVKSVRPDHFLSDYYFDYFEYVLPESRNSFMHSGYIDETDIKLKAFDMLTDLNYVLEAFASLENPLIKLNKLMSNRDQSHFSDSKAFAEYFLLIDALHAEHKADAKLRSEIKDFNLEFLSKHCSIEYLLKVEFQDLEKRVEEASHFLVERLGSFGFPIDGKTITKKGLAAFLGKEELKEPLKDTLSIHEKLFVDLLNAKYFFEGAKKYIYSSKLPSDFKTELSIYKKEQKFLYLLSELKKATAV